MIWILFACVLCFYIPFKTTLLNVELNEPRCVKRRETYFKDKLFAAATTQRIISIFCSIANSMLHLIPVVTMKFVFRVFSKSVTRTQSYSALVHTGSALIIEVVGRNMLYRIIFWCWRDGYLQPEVIYPPPCISYQVVCLKTEPNFSYQTRVPPEVVSMPPEVRTQTTNAV